MPLPLQAIPQGDLFVSAQAIQSNSARWSSRFHAAATALPDHFDFFDVPMGRVGAGFAFALTRAETNMRIASRLERPITLTVHKIIVSIIPGGIAGSTVDGLNWLRDLFYETILRLTVDETVMFEDHILHWAGTGLTGTPVQGSTFGYLSGSPAIAGRKNLKIPIGIPSRMNFNVQLLFNNNTIVGNQSPANVETFFRVFLEGNVSRAIDG